MGNYDSAYTGAQIDEAVGRHINTEIYYCDATATDQGAVTVSGDNTLKDFIDAIGTSKKATIILPHSGSGNTTTYVLGTAETVPSNIDLKFENGALIQPAAGITLTVYSPDHILAAPGQQIIDTTYNSTNPITFTTGYSDATPAWYKVSTRLDIEPGGPSEESGTITDDVALNFIGVNDAGELTKYAAVMARIEDDSDGAEEGELWFGIMDSGTFVTHAHISKNGSFVLTPTGGALYEPISRLSVYETDAGGGGITDGSQIKIASVAASVAGHVARYGFAARDDRAVVANSDIIDSLITHAAVRSVFESNTQGAVSGSLHLDVMNAGRTLGATGVDISEKGEMYKHINRTVAVSNGESPYTVAVNTSFTHYRTTGEVHFDLPAISSSGQYYNIGMQFTFESVGHALEIHPNASDRIFPTCGAVNFMLVTAAGTNGVNVTIRATGANRWTIISSIGTWTDGGAP